MNCDCGTTFNDLPDLARTEIFKNLEFDDLITCRRVCKSWVFVIDQYGSLFSYTASLENDTRQIIMNSEVPIKNLYVSDLDVSLPLTSRRGRFTTSVEHLKFGAKNRWTENGSTFIGPTSETNMKKLLKYCSNIISLKFGNKAFYAIQDTSFLQELTFLNLRELRIDMYGKYWANQHHAAIALLKHGIFPGLHKLTLLYSALSNYKPRQYYKLYVNTYEFIGRHHNTLKELNLFHTEQRFKTDSLISLIPSDRQDTIQCNLIKISLQSLKIGSLEVDEVNRAEFLNSIWNLDSFLMESQFNLQSLYIHGIPPDQSFRQLLSNNHKTLEEFDSYGIMFNATIDLDLSMFHDASNLKILTIGRSIRTSNVDQLPKSLVSLIWCDSLEWNQLQWILNNLTKLEKLHLQNFNNNILEISVGILADILQSLPKLKSLHLDCKQDRRGIMEFVRQKREQGELIRYDYGGRIYIGKLEQARPKWRFSYLL